LVDGYGNHFSFDSLMFYLTAGYKAGRSEDFFKISKHFFAEFLDVFFDVFSDCVNPAYDVSIDGNFNH
jgi:hypothetical protein